MNDTDAATVAAGTVPGTDGSPDGTVAFGSNLGLTADLPTEGVPAGAGNRSLAFNGTQAVTIPGTQQLSHAAIIAEGGFTYEMWFKWAGDGGVNSFIDYAGTEKFRIDIRGGGVGNLDMNFDQGSAAQILVMDPTANEWHYIAAVFEHDGEPVDAGLKIHGTLTWYYDSKEATGTANVTKDDFGDSLNRTIGVGGHPLGFALDFVNALMYEPRVSLGALTPDELLFGGGGEDLRILEIGRDENPEDPGVTISWNSRPDRSYTIEYSPDLVTWFELDDGFASAGEVTEFTHHFLPDQPELVGAPDVFYRVSEP